MENIARLGFTLMTAKHTKCPVAIQRAVIARDGPNCFFCGDTDGPYEWEHYIMVAMGHPDWTVSNTHRACVPCNRGNGKKAQFDRYKLRKLRKLEKAREVLKESKTKRRKNKIQSPGFSKTLRKKMNGKVERK
jgi:5-methylcytosine-specific restriction endonuclease McrA